jgi:RHS repeat-associated protein
LGSVREVLDATGTLRARYDYDAWGQRTKLSGDLDADFGFTGHLHHKETGLILTHYRAYDPRLGRWLSRDPIAENGGINLYGYVGNNPINAFDPTGEMSKPPQLVPPVPEKYFDIGFWKDAILDPGGAISFLEDTRREGHRQFPGEENSSMRHCVASCKSARRLGAGWARAAGIVNEAQGLILHDIPNFVRRRPWGETPWAFQPQDLADNERGFDAAKGSQSCEEECAKKKDCP